MSKVLVSLFFALGITPFGIVMRWLGKDPLELRRPANLGSYWKTPTPLRGFRRLS
jgi:hypothetical protein